MSSPRIKRGLPADGAEPRTRKWSKEEFYRLADLGYFQGQRAELVEGDIMVMSPQKPRHYSTTDQATELLRESLGKGFHVRMQGPIDLGPHAEPEPDIAVVAGKRQDYRKKHPTTPSGVISAVPSRTAMKQHAPLAGSNNSLLSMSVARLRAPRLFAHPGFDTGHACWACFVICSRTP